MIVVGTSPAGLAAAYLLRRQGHPVYLVETKAAEIGHAWAGWDFAGAHFERGYVNYMPCGKDEIDEFFYSLPLERYPIERAITGVYWNGKLQVNSPFLDLRDEPQYHALLGEVFNAAVSDTPHADRAMDMAAHLWGNTIALNYIKPILLKAYGNAQVKARALEIMPRLVLLDDKNAANLLAASYLSDRMAWPQQRTAAWPSSADKPGFYPVDGMRALAAAAVDKLQSMGVKVITEGPTFPLDGPGHETIWAAGVRELGNELQEKMPSLQRHDITQVNFIGEIKCQDLHSFQCLQPHLKTIHVTAWHNFTHRPYVTVRLLDTDLSLAPTIAMAELDEMRVLGNLKLAGAKLLPGEVIVPNSMNDDFMENYRRRITRPGIRLVGAHARAGLENQADILRHVWTTVNCYMGTDNETDTQKPPRGP